jgi:hypothetical protein
MDLTHIDGSDDVEVFLLYADPDHTPREVQVLVIDACCGCDLSDYFVCGLYISMELDVDRYRR